MAEVRLRRVYDEPSPEDGVRLLVDRIWPRGLRKEDARLDGWIKDVAPSTELRKWYGHQVDRFDEFRARYLDELEAPGAAEALRDLRKRVDDGQVTLLTATKDLPHSHAAVLTSLVSGKRR